MKVFVNAITFILDLHVTIFCRVNKIKFLNQSKFSVMTSYLVNIDGDETVTEAYIILMTPSLFSSKLLTSFATG